MSQLRRLFPLLVLLLVGCAQLPDQPRTAAQPPPPAGALAPATGALPPARPPLTELASRSADPRHFRASGRQALPRLPGEPQEVADELAALPTIDLTTPPDDLWQRIRNGFSMPDLDSPLVADRQAWYLNRPELLKRIFQRSRRYLYHIVDALEKRGMPTELALLPIIESSFNPLAASPARAMGIWQFIPSTGKTYKLQQDWWLDQRRDIVASTSAALDYLQYIYEMHGDWHLALASYNWGENAVGRAIEKNRARGLPADYQHLSMPEETRYYVPKLQAIKNIIAQPQLFGISLEPIPNRPYFETVERNGSMDVALAAKLAEIPVEEFVALNPAYSRPVMPDVANSPLVLPADKVQTFLDNLRDHEAQEKPLSAWHTHVLTKHEKLDGVARRYGISLALLKQLNGITRRTRLRPGFALLVPDKGALGPAALAVRLPQTPAPAAKAGKGKARHAGKPGHARKAGKPQGKRKAVAKTRRHAGSAGARRKKR